MADTKEIKISGYNSDGSKIEYNVIMIYDSDVTDKRYVFYTDGQKTDNGSIGVRVGYLKEKEGKYSITSITNPIEQQMLSEIYLEYTNKNR